MACGSGCCGAPNEANAPAKPTNMKEEPKDNIDEGDSGTQDNSYLGAASEVPNFVESTSSNGLGGKSQGEDPCWQSPTSPFFPLKPHCDSTVEMEAGVPTSECCGPKPPNKPTGEGQCSGGCCLSPIKKPCGPVEVPPDQDIQSRGESTYGVDCCTTTHCQEPDASKPSCQKGCCSTPRSASTTIPQEINISSQGREEQDRRKGCCSGNPLRSEEPIGQEADNHCSLASNEKPSDEVRIYETASHPEIPPRGLPQVEGTCEKGCCSKVESPLLDLSSTTQCFEGKPAPCCDGACIERLALRECRSGSPMAYNMLASEGMLSRS